MNPSRTKQCCTTGTTKVLLGLMVALLAGIAVLNLGPIIGINGDANAILTLFIGLAFTVIHGSMALGWKRLIAFLAITVIVSFSAEAIGVATGLVFGKYYYTENLGPRLLGVPPMIQIGYVAMGYASFITARVVLSAFRTPKRWEILGVTLATAFIMVSWDVAMDPYQSTISGDWIWQEGGPYFGVPLHNYVGWFCTVAAFTFLYLVYERFNPLPAPSGALPARSSLTTQKFFWSTPVVYYALIGIGILVTPLVGGVELPIALPNNYSGSLDNLMQSLSLISLFVMGTPVTLALVRLLSSRNGLNMSTDREQFTKTANLPAEQRRFTLTDLTGDSGDLDENLEPEPVAEAQCAH
jgi:uncharacterized membrane protein